MTSYSISYGEEIMLLFIHYAHVYYNFFKPIPKPNNIPSVLLWRLRALSCLWPVRSSSVTTVMLLKERSRLRARSVTMGTQVNPSEEQLQESHRSQRSQDDLSPSGFDL